MKDFFDFILSDKVYMVIAAVVVLLVVLLIFLIIKLAKESSKSKKINKQPMNTNYRENIQNPQRQPARNMPNPPQSTPVQNQRINTKFDGEDLRTESVVYQNQQPKPVMEQIPVLKPEVKQQIENNIRNNNVFETQALNVEMPRSVVEETQMLAKPKPKNLALLTYLEGEAIKEVGIVNNITNIGRDPEVCDVVISTDGHIGRKHALIYLKNDRFYLTDLNSKNGSFINGESLQGERQINDGDVIKLATTEIKFKMC